MTDDVILTEEELKAEIDKLKNKDGYLNIATKADKVSALHEAYEKGKQLVAIARDVSWRELQGNPFNRSITFQSCFMPEGETIFKADAKLKGGKRKTGIPCNIKYDREWAVESIARAVFFPFKEQEDLISWDVFEPLLREAYQLYAGSHKTKEERLRDLEIEALTELGMNVNTDIYALDDDSYVKQKLIERLLENDEYSEYYDEIENQRIEEELRLERERKVEEERIKKEKEQERKRQLEEFRAKKEKEEEKLRKQREKRNKELDKIIESGKLKIQEYKPKIIKIQPGPISKNREAEIELMITSGLGDYLLENPTKDYSDAQNDNYENDQMWIKELKLFEELEDRTKEYSRKDMILDALGKIPREITYESLYGPESV